MSIRVGAICGNHPRNLYLVNTLANEFELAGIVLQNREELMPTNTYFNCENDRKIFNKHFSNMEIKIFLPQLPNIFLKRKIIIKSDLHNLNHD